MFAKFFNLKESAELSNSTRSLGFGGLTGTLIGYLIFLHFPPPSSIQIPVAYFLTFGGLLGVSVHRFIDAALVQTLLKPARKTVSYYGTIAQLQMQRKKGWIDDKTYIQIKRELDRWYFLDIKIKGSNPNQLTS